MNLTNLTMRWTVFRGFQDEFKRLANFSTKKEAKAFVKANGWSLTKSDPVTPAVWIVEELCVRQ